METINIEKCTGYVWYSDPTSPKVYQNEPLVLTLNEKENPFVVEANFTDGETSHSIRYVDGKYIHSFCYTEGDVLYSVCNMGDKHIESSHALVPKNAYTDIEVFPQSMPNVYKMLFRRYWKAEEDALCNGWEVLQPAELVFVKFIEKKEDEK